MHNFLKQIICLKLCLVDTHLKELIYEIYDLSHSPSYLRLIGCRSHQNPQFFVSGSNFHHCIHLHAGVPDRQPSIVSLAAHERFLLLAEFLQLGLKIS